MPPILRLATLLGSAALVAIPLVAQEAETPIALMTTQHPQSDLDASANATTDEHGQQFGLWIGGSLWSDRLFYFGSFDTQERRVSIPNFLTQRANGSFASARLDLHASSTQSFLFRADRSTYGADAASSEASWSSQLNARTANDAHASIMRNSAPVTDDAIAYGGSSFVPLDRSERRSFDDATSFAAGNHYVKAGVQYDDLTLGNAQQKETAAYFQDEWAITPNVSLNAGVRWQRLDHPSEAATTDVAPRLELTWSPNESNTIMRVSAGRYTSSFAPNAFLLLDPTQLTTHTDRYTIGFDHAFTGETSIGVELNAGDVASLQSPSLLTRYRGMTATLRKRITDRFRTAATVSYGDSSDALYDQRWRAAASFTWDAPWWGIGLAGSYRYYTATHFSFTAGGQHDFDLRLDKRFPFGARSFTLFAQCVNCANDGRSVAALIDPSVASSPFGAFNTYGDPRTFQLGARFDF